MVDSFIQKDLISALMNSAFLDLTGNSRNILKDNLKCDMFMMETDFTDDKRRIRLQTSELGSERTQYWKSQQHEAIGIGEDEITINVPSLYAETINNHSLRKEFRKNSEIGGVDKFSNYQIRYIKCLQKRKDDLITKIFKSSQDDISPSNNSLHNQWKEINVSQLEEYKQNHKFMNWEYIDAVLKNSKWQNDKEFHKISMNELKNEYFIFQGDEIEEVPLGLAWSIPGQVECYVVQQMTTPNAYVQSRSDKANFEELISQLSNHSEIKSVLNKFCKRLSKRKSDFLDACIKHSIVTEVATDDNLTESSDSSMEQ